ncbi:BZ3500_MvSof-1268-A1-R1_Chr11-3g03500 [Microbotryum saponariae]|uniref:BZ3500_MvSof-1268-A1-R1_Chr11-3g03499 protein n=1 Tax=Microbotryum saponariae TaxID=289078 RepID=A0A2X0M363_9BASI|nr:BZ3500_MvSof-1268-A1-R1_Chr11-3g03499 [Microbotryum saponariae]SCZ94947.1 BZ3500_MvSof-1268-A1-R1_Chr11-3g03500 [Microbotryum saponariae]SDA03505.1 BZ3501_MvSof-1269-A2-R1_Chr11g03076 [Microbotryum saponariae]SDA03507.1 BZ3501_MvSof-1269-A2-R1_Chr11g03077 [Microbotryum saponariae]
MAGPQTAGSTSTPVASSHAHAEEDPEHIQQFGPVRGGIVFLESGTPAISRRSTRSGNSLKDGKSNNCDLSDDHDVRHADRVLSCPAAAGPPVRR